MDTVVFNISNLCLSDISASEAFGAYVWGV